MTSADLKNKTRTGRKIEANCPGCCPDTAGRAVFHPGWAEDPTSPEGVTPTYSCGNCGFEVARKLRRTKRQIAYDKLKASLRG
tara:strand:- start:1937 stop:2185 length:249 start_codon:yes stop_codon:yes gene_type:complete